MHTYKRLRFHELMGFALVSCLLWVGCDDQPQKTCPASCDDGNPCTVDSCGKDTSYQCTYTNVSNGASCSDGNLCNGAEVCQAPASGGASVCVAGDALACADDNGCTNDSCDPEKGCLFTNKPSGSPCTPEAACTTAGTCDGAGSCLPGSGKICDDNNPCTADACDPVLGCLHTPVEQGISCSDGNACNGAEQCDGSGACVAGTPLNCDDNNPCTIDACNGNGCSYTMASAGTPCSDGDFCNGEEACDGSGACVPGEPPSCAASDDSCQTASCDSVGGKCVISNKPDGTSCDDDNACTTASECFGGSCSKLTAQRCDSGWVRGDLSACDPTTGVCTKTPDCDELLHDDDNCDLLAADSPADACIYRVKACVSQGSGSEGCYINTCNRANGECVRASNLRNTLCNIDPCQTPSGGCPQSTCRNFACTLPPSNPPNCDVESQFQYGAAPSTDPFNLASRNQCQTLAPPSFDTNSFSCKEGVGHILVPVDCAASQPLGPPGPCEEYFEDPDLEGCCGLRPKVCRASDFGLPANTTGYTFSCEPSTGACVATPN